MRLDCELLWPLLPAIKHLPIVQSEKQNACTSTDDFYALLGLVSAGLFFLRSYRLCLRNLAGLRIMNA